jgi:beta-barrel assembly-enhancing protease
VGALRVATVWLMLATVVVSACASRGLPPIGAGGRPFEPDADETTLWARAEKEEQALAKKARPYDDPLLEEYLARLGDRLTPDEVRAAGAPGFKLEVLRDPALNAFAMPNGRIYLHTGLLSRLDNEAQLATIVSHEMTHVTHRHALGFQRDAERSSFAAATGARAADLLGGTAIGPTASAIRGLRLQLAAVAAISGYGRDLERDADQGGLESLVRAGYDPREAPKAFEVLRSESKDRGSLEIFFFGSYAKLTERMETTRELVRTRYAAITVRTAGIAPEDFQLRMRALVRENAYEDIRAGRFALAQRQLDRVLLLTPGDAVAHVYYGDLHRLQSQRAREAAQKGRSASLAQASYERAIELEPALPEPHRQLGFLYYQRKDQARAADEFRKYLDLKPDASDASRIKEYLAELDR